MSVQREAERLVRSFLDDISPPRLPENFSFDVAHSCGWGCRGSFLPSRYNSSRAKCVRCSHCAVFFSPNKFIFHYHRTAESTYTHPDAANFNSWRRHLKLGDPTAAENVRFAWEDIKAMFNGGNRKRMLSAALKGISQRHCSVNATQKRMRFDNSSSGSRSRNGARPDADQKTSNTVDQQSKLESSSDHLTKTQAFHRVSCTPGHQHPTLTTPATTAEAAAAVAAAAVAVNTNKATNFDVLWKHFLFASESIENRLFASYFGARQQAMTVNNSDDDNRQGSQKYSESPEVLGLFSAGHRSAFRPMKLASNDMQPMKVRLKTISCYNLINVNDMSNS